MEPLQQSGTWSKNVRRSTIALIPPGRRLVRFLGALQVAHLGLEHVAEGLLLRRGPAEVALTAPTGDGKVGAAHGVVGAVVAVDLEGVKVRVGSLVGLLEVIDLDLGSLLERLSCFAVFIFWVGRSHISPAVLTFPAAVACFCIK